MPPKPGDPDTIQDLKKNLSILNGGNTGSNSATQVERRWFQGWFRIAGNLGQQFWGKVGATAAAFKFFSEHIATDSIRSH